MLPYNTRSAASSNNGILRKTSVTPTASANVIPSSRQVELLVFGYACKLFRDDPKAWEIDQGKHLIPWMGNASLKIDRYDVRGALSELTQYEPPPGGYGNRLDYLSADEQRAEQLCEEERYFNLYNNEEELILQQEEDLKRLQQEVTDSSYGRVEFQYNDQVRDMEHGPNISENQTGKVSPSCDDVTQPYVAPKSLLVPNSIQLPATMKQHAIIEKTARFIAAQGTQMEILLKAKQSNNAQFDFLAQDNELNAYYKYIVKNIKSGSYSSEVSGSEKEASLPSNVETFNEQNLLANKPVIAVPTIKYQPSANCAYTQLISKIKGVPLPDVLKEDSTTVVATSETAENCPPPQPILLQYNEHTYIQATEDNDLNLNLNDNSCQEPQVKVLKRSSALTLAQNYSSGSDSDNEELPVKLETKLNFSIPTDNLKNIIDKTATYVIKNGRQFEETLRTKSEERFTFLTSENEYYPYYMYKITGDPDAASKEQKTRKAAAVAAALLSKKGITGPISFSIKGKDEGTPTNVLPALPQETSDDDEDHLKITESTSTPLQLSRNVPEHVQRAIKLVESQLMARNAAVAKVTATATIGNVAALNSNPSGSMRLRFDTEYNVSSSKSQIKATKSEQERNALFEQQQQSRQKELKKAEEKVKDKLAQIAREKLGGLISKDKQLQIERKRKAMAFLNQIKGAINQDGNLVTTENSSEARLKKSKDEYKSDSSETSVYSIPITSYGPEDDDDQDDTKKFDKQKTISDYSNSIQKSSTTTVLLSDDDDIELVSESKPTTSSYTKRSGIERNAKFDIKKSKKRKCVTDSSTSKDSCSLSDDSISVTQKYRSRRNMSRYDNDCYSSKKSKKSKFRRKKEKCERRRERYSNSYSHSSRKRSRCTSCTLSDDKSSEESFKSNVKKKKSHAYNRDTTTLPISPTNFSRPKGKSHRHKC